MCELSKVLILRVDDDPGATSEDDVWAEVTMNALLRLRPGHEPIVKATLIRTPLNNVNLPVVRTEYPHARLGDILLDNTWVIDPLPTPGGLIRAGEGDVVYVKLGRVRSSECP